MNRFWRKSSEAEATQSESQNLSALKVPEISQETCVSSVAIRRFLKLSRQVTDDSLKAKINSNHGDCSSLYKVHTESWQQRLQIFKECSKVAQDLRSAIKEDNKPEELKFDLRTNPYALEDYENELNKKFETVKKLENWIQNEKSVENILTARAKNVFSDNCNDKYLKLFLKAASEWQKDLQI